MEKQGGGFGAGPDNNIDERLEGAETVQGKEKIL